MCDLSFHAWSEHIKDWSVPLCISINQSFNQSGVTIKMKGWCPLGGVVVLWRLLNPWWTRCRASTFLGTGWLSGNHAVWLTCGTSWKGAFYTILVRLSSPWNDSSAQQEESSLESWYWVAPWEFQEGNGAKTFERGAFFVWIRSLLLCLFHVGVFITATMSIDTNLSRTVLLSLLHKQTQNQQETAHRGSIYW